MSSGTKIIQSALERIGAHSVVSPANPESIQTGKDTLNGMLAMWWDNGIITGAVPLSEPGDELSEPMGAMNGIINNLSIELAPLFPSAQISTELRSNALKQYKEIVRRWKQVEIPKPVARETLPLGQGNRRRYGVGNSYYQNPFFLNGSEIG